VSCIVGISNASKEVTLYAKEVKCLVALNCVVKCLVCSVLTSLVVVLICLVIVISVSLVLYVSKLECIVKLNNLSKKILLSKSYRCKPCISSLSTDSTITVSYLDPSANHFFTLHIPSAGCSFVWEFLFGKFFVFALAIKRFRISFASARKRPVYHLLLILLLALLT
jgi:hypothetical protein